MSHPSLRIRSAAGLPTTLLLAGVAVGLFGQAACGLKTPPRPAAEVLPPTSGVRAWQRESRVMVTWSAPASARVGEFGAVEGYVLTVQARPVVCVGCALPAPLEVRVGEDTPGVVRQGGRLYYPLDLQAGEHRLTITVRTAHASGTSPPSPPAVVERGRAIPAATLDWRWAGSAPTVGAEPPGTGRTRSVQFFWEAPRERTVHVLGAAGGPREEVRRFRANIYRRIPPQDFPSAPLNGKPLNGTSWIVPPLEANLPPDAPGESYQLRLVDQFGNEGAASPEVLVPRNGAAGGAGGVGWQRRPAGERAS